MKKKNQRRQMTQLVYVIYMYRDVTMKSKSCLGDKKEVWMRNQRTTEQEKVKIFE